MKKYGVIAFKNTQNIGDDIQTYASTKLLPKVDYFIERESLNEFVSKDGEYVNTIMNGWYIHDIYSFPPSKFINPLMISMHFTNHLYDTCPEYIGDLFLQYLKNHSPIGCRDSLLKKYFDENKVKNYFSGCLTLTINPFNNVKKDNYVCAVDISDEELAHLKKIEKNNIKIITHFLDNKENSKISYEERMKNVENLLKIYQGAKYVVTSRLHCALPCLAINEPVILIKKDNIDNRNRMGDFYKYLFTISSLDFIKGKIDSLLKNGFANKDIYLNIRKKLLSTVDNFLKYDCIEYKKNIELKELYINDTVNLKKYFKYLSEFQRKNINIQIEELKKQYNDLYTVYQTNIKISNDRINKLKNNLILVENEIKK